MRFNEKYQFTTKYKYKSTKYLSIRFQYIDRLEQERSDSIANALELRLSCTNSSISSYFNLIKIDGAIPRWWIM